MVGAAAIQNRVLFLTGSRDTFQKVLDSARQTRALQSIEDELKSESTPTDDPQWRALDTSVIVLGCNLPQHWKKRLTRLFILQSTALRTTGTDLAFAGNQSGEATLRHTPLEGAQKFTSKIDDDSFRTRAEARLFGSAETKSVLWSDFKRAAAVNTPLAAP
ncbi:MAG: hypothetical protein IPG64_18585 [Haliea sp.]|nr:hypothetical protein [Haliea sp.]